MNLNIYYGVDMMVMELVCSSDILWTFVDATIDIFLKEKRF